MSSDNAMEGAVYQCGWKRTKGKYRLWLKTEGKLYASLEGRYQTDAVVMQPIAALALT